MTLTTEPQAASRMIEERAVRAAEFARSVERLVYQPVQILVVFALLMRVPVGERAAVATMVWIASASLIVFARFARRRSRAARSGIYFLTWQSQVARLVRVAVWAVALTTVHADLGPGWECLVMVLNVGVSVAVSARVVAAGLLRRADQLSAETKEVGVAQA